MNAQCYRFAVAVAWALVGCAGPAGPPDDEGPGNAGLERIVLSSLRPGNWDIFYFESPAAAPRRLTDHPGLDYGAEFSPDGRWVIFTSERRGNPDLYGIDLEGAPTPRLLIDSAAMEDQATVSPDGQSLAFMSTMGGDADIYVIPFDPTSTQRMDAATNLTRDPGGDFRPAFSPDSRRIAFTSDRDVPVYGHPAFSFTRQREGELYVMDRDGANAERLTDSRGWDGSAEWSPDGETIYFYSDRPRELPGAPTSPILGQEGGFRIWAIDADGSDPRPVTPEGVEALAPALTPGGRLAYQTRSTYQDWFIRSVALDGTGAREETDGARNYWLPDYASDGAMVVHGVGPVAADSQAVEDILGAGALLAADFPARLELPDRPVQVYPMRHTTGLVPHPFRNEVVTTVEDAAGSRLVHADFDGSNERTIFEEPGIGIIAEAGLGIRLFDMKWSEDGRWITYTRGAFFGGPDAEADIWILDVEGGGRVNLTGSDDNDGIAAFSPDGTRLAFRSSRNGNFDLYLMDRDGGNVIQLTDDAARDNFPMFSPDGNSIVFSSDRDSGLDALGFKTFDNYILHLNPDGTPGEIERLTDHPGQDSHPMFSPDGAWVVYTSERAGINDEEPLVQEVVFGPQMYGEIFAQRLSDGLQFRITHNKWEEGNPFWLRPAE